MLDNPDRAIGGLAVQRPSGVELAPPGRDDLAAAVSIARAGRDLPALEDPSVLRDRYEALLASADTIAYLARHHGAPAGLAVMQLRRRLNYATFEGWISDLWELPAAAGHGIAETLLAALIAEWRLRGSHRLVASVEDGPVADGRRELLRAQGFEEALLEFRLRPIGTPSPSVPHGAVIRPVDAEDADAVTRLIAEFGPRRSPVPERLEAIRRTFAAHLRDAEVGRWTGLLAELDGAPVGICAMERQRPYWSDELHAWIADLVVTEPVRGRGIGRALLAAALGAAGSAATQARLESGSRRRTAHRLYAAAGFEQTGRTWILERDG